MRGVMKVQQQQYKVRNRRRTAKPSANGAQQVVKVGSVGTRCVQKR